MNSYNYGTSTAANYDDYSTQDRKILTWNKENYEELLSSFTDDELCEMYYFVYHHPACPMVIHSCSDDWESKYIIVYEYICLWLVSLINDGPVTIIIDS